MPHQDTTSTKWSTGRQYLGAPGRYRLIPEPSPHQLVRLCQKGSLQRSTQETKTLLAPIPLNSREDSLNTPLRILGDDSEVQVKSSDSMRRVPLVLQGLQDIRPSRQ